MGTLHVRESYRKQGLASLLIKALSQKVALDGEDVFVQIYEFNKASKELFQKLGFQFINQVMMTKAFKVEDSMVWCCEDDI